MLKLTSPFLNITGSLVYLNDEIYFVGGGSHRKGLYKWDKNSKTAWISLAEMKDGRMSIANNCMAWDKSIWVFGGHWYYDPVDEYEEEYYEHLPALYEMIEDVARAVERYDPITNQWTSLP